MIELIGPEHGFPTVEYVAAVIRAIDRDDETTLLRAAFALAVAGFDGANRQINVDGLWWWLDDEGVRFSR